MISSAVVSRCRSATRALSIVSRNTRSYSQENINPWFVSPTLQVREKLPPPGMQHFLPAHFEPIPFDAPDHLKILHAALSKSPLLDPSELIISKPIKLENGPGIPIQKAHGARRKRGSTNGGIGIEFNASLWEWAIYAQVKEGTEGRGALDAVMKQVRSILVKADRSLPIPPYRRRTSDDGWAMLDVGDVAVHVMSREAKQRYFGSGRW